MLKEQITITFEIHLENMNFFSLPKKYIKTEIKKIIENIESNLVTP